MLRILSGEWLEWPTIEWPSWLESLKRVDPQHFLIWLAVTLLAILLTRRAFRTKPKIPWQLGNVTVDLRGGSHTIHAVVAGMSGTGKSTAVLPLLMIPDMPALVIAFDNSRPIRDLFEAMGWTIWQPGGNLGWDILSGPAQIVSEALVAGMPESGQSVGIMSGMVQERVWEALDALDARGAPRTIGALTDALSVRTRNLRQDTACQDWAIRFRRIAKSLGPSLGFDLDLIDAMRRGEKVLVLPNRFLSPKDAPIVGGIALVQARRVAQEVGNFLIVVEEAGQAGQRQQEMNALAQAGRDRGCPLVVLTQNAAKLPDEVINNVKVWISFAQESRHETNFAAERLRIEPSDLLLENFPNKGVGVAWVRSPDHKPSRQRLSLPRLKSYAPVASPLPTSTSPRRRMVVTEVSSAPELPALPPPTYKVQEIISQLDRSGDCWLWQGRLDRDGYGLVWWEGQNRRVHRIVFEQTYGEIPLGTNGKPLDLDHRPNCPRHCANPLHVEPVTRRVNVQRMHRTRGHMVAD